MDIDRFKAKPEEEMVDADDTPGVDAATEEHAESRDEGVTSDDESLREREKAFAEDDLIERWITFLRHCGGFSVC